MEGELSGAGATGPVLFEERQRFVNRILGFVLLGLLLLVTLFVWQDFRSHLPADRQLMMFLPAVLVAVLLFLELHVTVQHAGVRIRMLPFANRTIAPAQIARWEARTYRPIREYGGWGVRFGPRGRAYNVSGNRGVEITLANGKRVLIGSQRSDDLAAAIARIAKA
ncbi:MAG: hypothetical protein DMF77_03100 [Acidobacteria bacterium]|nr:MAG: hypothetical protein DMF77_03100 [Acidobacteriota bacterium]